MKHNKNLKWFGDNYEQISQDYKNQWLAIIDKEIVSHGCFLQEVLEKAYQKGYRSPLIVSTTNDMWRPFTTKQYSEYCDTAPKKEGLH